MINQQENQALTDSHHRQQCQLYEDLSTLMQVFKRLLLAIEDIAFSTQRQTDAQSLRHKLNALAKTLQSLFRKYSGEWEQLRIEARTFQRFVCRLFETIEIYQLKYSNSSSQEAFFAVGKFAAIETALKDPDCLHDLLKLISTLKCIVEKLVSFDSPVAAKHEAALGSPTKKIVLERMEARMIKLRNVTRGRGERKESERCDSEEQEEGDQSWSVSFTQKRTLPISYSIASDLQKRFQLYRGLQLDFISFKTSYFTAKSNTELFYREYLQRNGLNSRIIKHYSDDFMLFQKKRMRNHRRIISKSIDGPENSAKSAEGESCTRQQEISVKECSDKKVKVAVIHSQNLEEQRPAQRDASKASYKMNNIYLTFGKKQLKQNNPRHHPNITPNILKNRQQFHNLYTSFCSKSQPTTTQSIHFQSPLKAFAGIKGSQRIKTSPDKNGLHESQKMKAEQREAIIKAFKEADQLPFRAVNKRRYLELDCTSKKEISLNKVILTGNGNARHIKLDRLTEAKDILF